MLRSERSLAENFNRNKKKLKKPKGFVLFSQLRVAGMELYLLENPHLLKAHYGAPLAGRRSGVIHGRYTEFPDE